MTELQTQETKITIVEHISTKQEIIAHWSNRVATGDPTAEEHAEYIILRGLVCKTPQTPEIILARLLNGFSPVTNKTKLINGHGAHSGLRYALMYLGFHTRSQPHWKTEGKCAIPVGPELVEQVYVMAQTLRKMLPND